MGLLGNSHTLKVMHGQFVGLLLGHLANPDRGQRQVFQHGHVREKVEVLEHHADFAAHGFNVFDIVAKQDAIDEDFTALIGLKAVQGADQRRFT